VAHGNYSSIASFRTKKIRDFAKVCGFFRDISTLYSLHHFSRNPKRCFAEPWLGSSALMECVKQQFAKDLPSLCTGEGKMDPFIPASLFL